MPKIKEARPTGRGTLKFALFAALVGVAGLLLRWTGWVPSPVYWTLIIAGFGAAVAAVVFLIVIAENA
ncbi:MAG: hypothetical protein Kow0069_09420 [Promethearchaeota archaeon]